MLTRCAIGRKAHGDTRIGGCNEGDEPESAGKNREHKENIQHGQPKAAAGRNRRCGGIAGNGRGLDAPGYMLLGAFPQGCGRIMPDVVKGFHISIIASTQGMCQISKL